MFLNISRAEESSCGLLVVDLQEKFVPIIQNWDEVIRFSSRLIKFFRLLSAPIVVTEQYPKGLGSTVPSIRELLGQDVTIHSKTTFSSCGADELIRVVEESDCEQWILCGIETHVCIQQTVFDLLEMDYEVFLAADAISSRSKTDRDFALLRMEKAGAILSTSESLMFEILQDAQHPLFKKAIGLVK